MVAAAGLLACCNESVPKSKLNSAPAAETGPPLRDAGPPTDVPLAGTPPTSPSGETPAPTPAAQTMPTRDFTVPPDETLRQKLTPLQWSVTREEGTERAFQNEYWDNHQEGIYVCIVSGKPLFSSADKFDSGTGWPSFTKPLDSAEIVTRDDRKFFTTRTEVRTKTANTHLGHVFDDGPPPTGLRYCLNSAALRFVPKNQMDAEGYGPWLKHFDKTKPGVAGTSQ